MRRIVSAFVSLALVGGTAGCASSPADMIPASERAMATVDEQPTGQTPVSVEAMLEKIRRTDPGSEAPGYTLHFQPGAAAPAPADMQSLLQEAGDKSVGRIVAAGSNGLDGLDAARLALSRARAVAAGLGQPAVPAALVFDPALPPDTVVVEWSSGGTPSG